MWSSWTENSFLLLMVRAPQGLWKSTKKGVEYEKLTGTSAGNELSQIDEDVFTEPPQRIKVEVTST